MIVCISFNRKDNIERLHWDTRMGPGVVWWCRCPGKIECKLPRCDEMVWRQLCNMGQVKYYDFPENATDLNTLVEKMFL